MSCNKNNKIKIKIGSRKSVLAIRQAEIVMEAIRKSDPSIKMDEMEIIPIQTRGDEILDRSLDKIGGKGLFVKELERALLNGDVDLAVHSCKDMPHEEQPELTIAALSHRESPFDAFVLPMGVKTFEDLGVPVGSASRRRTVQFQMLYPSVTVEPVRGNVPSRLAKLDRAEYSGLILAHAGLLRLGLGDRVFRVFTLEEMIPAASQGIIEADRSHVVP